VTDPNRTAVRIGGGTELECLLVRVERKYANDRADNAARPPEQRRDVSGWLAGVSYADWFALVDAYRKKP
jgi:hypothetical protein